METDLIVKRIVQDHEDHLDWGFSMSSILP